MTAEGTRIRSADADKSEISFLQLVNALLRHRAWVIGTPIVFLLIGITAVLAKERTYTATGAFLTQASSSPISGLSGVAAQLGINVPSGGGISPQFYAELLRTPSILRAVADTVYASNQESASRTLAQEFNITAADSLQVRELVVKTLYNRIAPTTDPRTGIVQYAVTTHSADLSWQIAAVLLKRVHNFSVEIRRRRADAERQFVEDRLAASRAGLRIAEERLQAFLQRNRSFQNDPQLVFENDRLLRDVRIREQLYTALAQALEQASIESDRDTPIISIVESPQLPVFPDPRRLPLFGAMALLAGLIVGALIAVARERTFARDRHEAAEFAEFQTLKERALSDMHHPVRAIRNALRPRPTEIQS